MKEVDAFALVGQTVFVRVDGSSYVGVLQRIVSKRAWRAVVKILALEKIASAPGAIVPVNECVTVYGGNIARFEGEVRPYHASIDEACFAEITSLRDAPVPPKLEAALAVDDLAGDQLALWWDATS